MVLSQLQIHLHQLTWCLQEVNAYFAAMEAKKTSAAAIKQESASPAPRRAAAVKASTNIDLIDLRNDDFLSDREDDAADFSADDMDVADDHADSPFSAAKVPAIPFASKPGASIQQQRQQQQQSSMPSTPTRVPRGQLRSAFEEMRAANVANAAVDANETGSASDVASSNQPEAASAKDHAIAHRRSELASRFMAVLEFVSTSGNNLADVEAGSEKAMVALGECMAMLVVGREQARMVALHSQAGAHQQQQCKNGSVKEEEEEEL